MLVVLLHLAATETAKPFMQCTKEHLRPTDDDNGGWFIEPACTELRLAMQMMGDDGVLAMAESLKAHKKLKLLELAFNEIFDEGAVALAGALRHNRKLESVYLWGNNITDDGAVALADALVANKKSKVQKLMLQRNQIKARGVAALHQARMVKEDFHGLELDTHQFEYGSAKNRAPPDVPGTADRILRRDYEEELAAEAAAAAAAAEAEEAKAAAAAAAAAEERRLAEEAGEKFPRKSEL